MSVTQQQVVSLLENVLFESATQAAANEASWQANPAATSVSSLAAAMANSGEEKIAATIVGYYLSALGRAPTAAEIHFYTAFAEQGLTQSQIAAGEVSSASWTTIASFFADSPEFAARAHIDNSLGALGGLLEAVPWLYESVLGRTPSVGEISYYDTQVTSGSGLSLLFREFTASPEFHTDTDTQIAAALASYGVAAASGQPPATVGASVTLGPPPPPPPPVTVTHAFGALTTGADTINDNGLSGAHTYQAILGTGATLNSNDSLTGNGLATLTITDNGTGSFVTLPVAPLTLSGIHTVTLTTGEDAGGSGGHPFNLSGVSGLTAFNLTATGTGGDYITVGSNVAVTASTNSAFFSMQAIGTGNTLALTDPALTTLSVITFTGDVGSIDLTTTGGPTSLTLDILDISSLQFTDSSNHLTALDIGGGVNTDSISAINDSALVSLTVSSGWITFGSVGTPISLGADITTVDLSSDADTIGTNYFTVNSNNIAIALGKDSNVIDLNSKTGANITVGLAAIYNSAAPNLILENVVAGTKLTVGSVGFVGPDAVGSLAQLISDTAAQAQGNVQPYVLYSTLGGADLYIVDVTTTSGTPGNGNTAIIKIVGGAGLEAGTSWSGGTFFTL